MMYLLHTLIILGVHSSQKKIHFFHQLLMLTETSMNVTENSSMETLPRRRMPRRVSFSRSNSVEMLDMQEEERTEMWYSRRELSSIKTETRQLVKKLKQQDAGDDSELLGLADTETQEEKRAKQRAAIRSVLEQQYINRQQGVDDPRGLAQISAANSRWAKEAARIAAESVAEIKNEKRRQGRTSRRMSFPPCRLDQNRVSSFEESERIMRGDRLGLLQ